MLTRDKLRNLAPRADDNYVKALVDGDAILARWGITTPLRAISLLATACHETGGLTIVRENGNYSAARLVQVWPQHFSARSAKAYAHNPSKLFNFIYGPTTSVGRSLGNTEPDDGYRFRGGGLLQTTGRDNYTRIGRAIGVDLAGHPELIEDATVSLQAACWELSQFLSYCDMGERGWRAVCNGVNRGNPHASADPIGWSDRQLWYAKCCDVLGVSAKVVDDTLRMGDQGPMVKAVQERLTALGYPAGRADGIFGNQMRSAVLTFQAENGLPSDGVIAAQTRAALNSEAVIAMPLGERATDTANDLRKAGSETVANTDAIKTTSKIVGAASAVTAAADSALPGDPAPVDAIGQTKQVLTEVGVWKMLIGDLEATFRWITSHWWIAGLVLAFAFYRWGAKIEWRRVLDHRAGINLGR